MKPKLTIIREKSPSKLEKTLRSTILSKNSSAEKIAKLDEKDPKAFENTDL